MKISVQILRLIDIIIAVSVLLLCDRPLAAQDHRIIDRPVDSFDTGLPIPRLGAVFWLDDHQLLTYALPEGAPDVVWTGGDTLMRVVLVNFATKRVQVIAEHAVVMRFDQETLAAVIGPMDRKTDAREIHVTPEGNVVETARFAPGEPLPVTRPVLPKDQVFRSLGRKSDGYLLGDKTKLLDHTRSGTPIPTTWVRPGRPDLPLSVGFDEIGPTVEYVAFLNKYLLNPTDTREFLLKHELDPEPCLAASVYIRPFACLHRMGRSRKFRIPASCRTRARAFRRIPCDSGGHCRQ